MPYLSSYRGDYLGSYRGDPGLFGFIGKKIKQVAGFGLKLLTGGGTTVVRQAPPSMPTQAFPGGQRLTSTQQGRTPKQQAAARRVEQIRAGAELPKRARMNVANPKALRRAIRRQAGFVKLAKRALKGSGYTVAPRGARRSTRPMTIRETGPGSVTVR